MKNNDIVTLMMCGVAEITSHCLTAEEAYKVYRFRRSLKKASESIFDAEREMLEEAGIKDAAAFNERLKALRASREPIAELEEMTAKLDRYEKMRFTLMNEEAPELYAPKLDYAKWKALQDENHTDKRDPLVGSAEELLEGVMWIEPED